MFDRRIKIFLFILVLLTMVLLGRALQLQVFERSLWAEAAVRVNTRPELIETTRGRILDRNGLVIAENKPCIDACVDYRAIPTRPDPTWVKELALSRLRNSLDGDYRQADREERQRLIDAEIEHVKDDIRGMWERLATCSGSSLEQMDDLRQTIVRRVDMRRRFVWYSKYEQALQKHEKRDPTPWYRRWLIEDGEQTPEVDQYFLEVAEQTQAHVILPAISSEVQNYLGKNLDSFPGLVLRPSIRRDYRFGDTAAHLIGHLAHVSRENLGDHDPNRGNDLRQYLPNDLIGRSGLEALCEPLLRGTRGRIERDLTIKDRIVEKTPPSPGADVHCTIDIELQREIQQIFTHILINNGKSRSDPEFWEDTLRMPGAAVVIDVPTGEVISLVSYPSYDLNTMDEDYSSLLRDVMENPLLNRATQVALEPGSTVKPMVGLGAITQGLVPLDMTVECTGYLTLNGKEYQVGRCWTATNWGRTAAHHLYPVAHPTGFLSYSDALERSCNVFFETMADKLGMEGLRYWYNQFGLGRPTGIGISEVRGEIPGDRRVPSALRKSATWFSGIGQSQVLATPIQIANVAATIARGGVWMRPRLVPDGIVPSTQPADAKPDRVNLNLSPAALAEAKKGMFQVVNGQAGTGRYHDIDKLGVPVAGKTGSAQAAKLRIPVLDENDQPVYRAELVPVKDAKTGQIRMAERKLRVMKLVPLGTHANPNQEAKWYRGTGANEDRISHAWYMGFAPAEHPKIAFAVMVEYGGGGGATAGYVAKQMLDAMIKRGYLAKEP